jgi:hypothetical protein
MFGQTAMQPPQLFDHRRLAARLARASARSGSSASPQPAAEGFLDRHAASEMCDRLGSIKRRFRSVAVLLGASGEYAAALSARLPDAHIAQFGLARFLAEGPAAIEAFLAPASHDLVIAGLGLHWANDMPGVLALARASLQTDGLFMAALPGEGTLGELRQCLLAAEAETTDGAAMRTGPFADVKALGGLLQRAGFVMPVADIDRLTLRYASFAGLIADLRDLAMTNVLAGPGRPLARDALVAARRLYARDHADPDGRMRATFSIAYLAGWTLRN